jgi:hypothetical protein
MRSGTTNDGKTARRVFQDLEESPKITGMKKETAEHFSIILRAVSRVFDIDVKTIL